jgi:zeta-carotene desaturase
MRGIVVENGGVTCVRFDEQKTESGDAYVFALPHAAFSELLPDAIRENDSAFSNLGNIKDAPITGVHFWFDREVMDEPFVTLLDTHTQWIFNKTMLYGDANAGKKTQSDGAGEKASAGQYLQMVISASYELIPKSRQEIIAFVLKEVHQALPKSRDAELVKATVIKETGATFSPEPGVDRWRPRQKSAINKMFLAGDWTATGWPATMEGAVRSGYLAAEAVLQCAGTPQKIMRDDLTPDGLVKFFV